MNQSIKAVVTIAMCMYAMAACSKIGNDSISTEGSRVCKMVFEGNVTGYESTELRSGSATKATSSWQEGDKVYIAFYKGTEIIAGTAQYSEADGWTINFDGDLAEGSNLKCEVRFFVNPTFANEYTVNLNPHSEIYEDVDAKYEYSGGNLRVTASMVPKVGRIRFTGNAGDKIFLTGIETYSNYAPANNSFATIQGMLSETVADNGSTTYIYGYCYYDDRKIGVVGSDFAYTKYLSDSIYKKGDSGYMAIPSTSSHNGWKNGLYVTAGDVEFKMIPVPGYEGGFFLIGETEVTWAMSNMTLSVNNPQYPSYTTYTGWNNFITKLNYATHLHFYIPSSGEWIFAAQGGLLSQGYTYSGSNNPSDVAWYVGNSGNNYHPVKQLAPNELGIYDMSGNIHELIGNFYSGYGGNYSSTESAITINSSTSVGSNVSVGLRLALKCE